jgi:uncharacterized protein (TIGR01777 family)
MHKVLLAGGTGLIGKEIINQLDKAKYEIHILSRSSKENKNGIFYHQWNTNKKTIDINALKVDTIINLAGAGIADKKWTTKRKEILIDSRVNSAKTIMENLEKLPLEERPKQYISASAIGFYGDSGEQLMKEGDSPVDDSFLSVCTQKWEAAAFELKSVIPTVALVRIGIVLSTEGGALQKMLIPFKLGMASYFGNGSMKYSWVHIKDIARLHIFIMENNLQGIYNGTAPEVVSNKILTHTIKDVKGGLSIMNAVPTFALRLAMGEMADVVLSGNNVSSNKIIEAGFNFEFPRINEALKDLLN